MLRVRLPYNRGFYLPAVLLHLGLVLRIGIGDGIGLDWARQWGGVLNVIALLGFAVLAAASAIIAMRKRRGPTKPNRTGAPGAPTEPTAPTAGEPSGPTAPTPTTKEDTAR